MVVEWTTNCEEAFDQLKGYLRSTSLLNRQIPQDILLLYLSVMTKRRSSVLMGEEESFQMPMYNFNIPFKNVELRFSTNKKVRFALLLND